MFMLRRNRMPALLFLSALGSLSLNIAAQASASDTISNSPTMNIAAVPDAAENMVAPSDHMTRVFPSPNAVSEAELADFLKAAGKKEVAEEKEDIDELGWLKVVLSMMAGAVGVLGTQWITARTNRDIAKEQAAISRSAVNVAGDAAKASALGASAAVESAGAARENAAVAARNADNVGVHAVARLRQDWINTVRTELSELHSLLANYRSMPTVTAAQKTAHEQRQREANLRRAKLALLLNPREIPAYNLSIVIRHLEDPMLTLQQRARWSRWIIRWGQILLKEEWDRVRGELRGEVRQAPSRRKRRWQK